MEITLELQNFKKTDDDVDTSAKNKITRTWQCEHYFEWQKKRLLNLTWKIRKKSTMLERQASFTQVAFIEYLHARHSKEMKLSEKIY